MKLVCLILLLSLNSMAQSVLVNELEPGLKLPQEEGFRIQAHEPSLIKSQVAFQKKVFTKASVTAKTESLDFEEKEDLLEALEGGVEAEFLKQYPKFNAAEFQRMQKALYE